MIEDRIRRSFDEQGFMQLLGAELREAADGICVIELAARPDLKQQHGFVHAVGAQSARLRTRQPGMRR